jgi:hypothetical protein
VYFSQIPQLSMFCPTIILLDSPAYLLSKCFSWFIVKNKDIVIYDYSVVIKIKKFIIEQYYCHIHRSHLPVASCPRDVLDSPSPSFSIQPRPPHHSVISSLVCPGVEQLHSALSFTLALMFLKSIYHLFCRTSFSLDFPDAS